MLDADTKRRIDSCRDMLVGKVPDPKSQVEQITIALIYKFMDDMDAEAEELGGARSFFAGDYARYGWARLLSPTLGGFEMLALYGEAISTMGANPGVPPLFRDIFKNAYLPYRDPETLRAFLKEINGFTYDHSERLGDAFEYLLSVLGSQGDAGQFRTPRHIIDFIVAVVDPQKAETILDPACGTAGFLISSYKHILAANRRPALTADERARLARSLVGYDISPDMVRLSLVNLYLHGFPRPQIIEYDTLTSDEQWPHYFDVILANPPFMSPKGGIKPHKRFSVQSSRSEVLFVDYIAEHLTPQGRAGVIVPEGIIFQSGGAYKSLRKMLVDNHLVAVVSLPSGVFNPYSAVKTSILLLDKHLSKITDSILFLKVEHDGHDLGAQRRAAVPNDLPAAKSILANWMASIRDYRTFELPLDAKTCGATAVPKTLLAASGEYNLSADRYSSKANILETEWPTVPLRDILALSGKERIGDDTDAPIMSITMKSGLVDQGDKFKKRIASADISGYKKVLRNELVVGFPIDEGVLGFQTKYDFAAVSPAYDIWKLTDKTQSLTFLELLFRSNHARMLYRSKMRGTANRRRTIDRADFLDICFPLPPLAVQQEIVAEIGSYQKVIDGARQVVENYKPRIRVRPEWPVVELGEVSELKNGLNFTKDSRGGKIRIVGVRHFQQHLFVPVDQLDEVQIDANLDAAYLLKEGDILFVRSNGNKELVGRSIVVPAITERMSFSGFTIRCRLSASLDPLFLTLLLKTDSYSANMKSIGMGANISNLSQDMLKRIKVPLPDLPTQRAIVAEIEEEQRWVGASRELVRRFEGKITAAISRVWGEEVPEAPPPQ